MNDFQQYLLIGACATLLISLRVPRAGLWILAGAASFLITSLWQHFRLPMSPLFNACCDALMCFAIGYVIQSRKGQAREWKLFRIFQASVLVSVVFLGFTIFTKPGPHAVYVAALEAVNWAALLLIFGTAAMQRIEAYGGGRLLILRSLVRWSREALLAPAKPLHWWAT